VKELVIAGCGLLGTSVAMGFRRCYPDAQIFGIEPAPQAREAARQIGVYNRVFATLAEGQEPLQERASGANVVGVAATPPAELAGTMRKLAQFCALVMDVGSIKAPVVESLQADNTETIAPSIVPCHPMAGSHQQGPAAGVTDLFDGRWVFVVPIAGSAPQAVQAAHNFWQDLGAQTLEIDALEHDLAVAHTSHLPHLLASAYMGMKTPVPAAAGTGFMEFTRLAKANPEMWSQVLTANQAAWRPLLGRYIESLKALDQFVADGNQTEVQAWLAARKQEREALE